MSLEPLPPLQLIFSDFDDYWDQGKKTKIFTIFAEKLSLSFGSNFLSSMIRNLLVEKWKTLDQKVQIVFCKAKWKTQFSVCALFRQKSVKENALNLCVMNFDGNLFENNL